MTDEEEWKRELLSSKCGSNKTEQREDESKEVIESKPVNNRKNDDRFICDL